MTLILRLTSVRSFRVTVPTLGSSAGLGSVWFGGCPTCDKLRTSATRYQNSVGFRTYANVAAKKKDPRLELYTVLSSRAQQLSKPEKGEVVRQRQKKQEILKTRKVSSHVRLEPVMSPPRPPEHTLSQRGLSSKSNINMYTSDQVEKMQSSQRNVSAPRWQTQHKKPFRSAPRVTESVVEKELDVLEEMEEEEAQEKLDVSRRQEEMEKMKNVERRQNEEQAYILSFMEACVSIGEVERATRTLHYLKNQKKKRKHLNADIYNVVLKGWAKQANMDKIRHLFFMMTKDGHHPDLQSYAAALECMGRAGLTGAVPMRCVKQMYKEGFNLENIFRDCTFQADEQEYILKAIQDGCGMADFAPPPLPLPQRCTTDLVSSIYADKSNDNYSDTSLQARPLFTEEEVVERCNAQLEMETQHWLKVESVEGQRQSSQEVLKLRELLQTHKTMWETGLLQAFRTLKKQMDRQSKAKGQVNIYPFLCVLEEQEYVDMMVQAICLVAVTGDPLLIIARDLGTKIQQKYRIKQKLQSGSVEKIRQIYQDYCSFMVNNVQGGRPGQARELWYQLEGDHSVSPVVGDECAWPINLIINLGSLLVDVMVREVKIDNNLFRKTSEQKLIPALYHMYTYRNIKQVGIIKPHPMLVQLVEGAQDTSLVFDSSLLPMLMPPVPWSSVKKGGFLLSPTKLMRSNDATLQHELLLEKVGTSELYPILDSLNQLGACAWKINQPILDLVIQVFNNKGSKELDIPQPVSEAPTFPKVGTEMLTNGDKQAMRKQMAQVRKLRSEMHSLRMDMLYKLSIANRFRHEIFYFPHNMDFRGRVYPCPPHFNHLGSDVARSILVFAEGHPLGEKGLDWLKIHLVNLTGFKKKNSQTERLEYANEMMEEVLDSADHPMMGRKWWMTADEPWQALACCMEIANAVRSPDPQAYISHFPVHQDGSCNGLQHYAALGRDITGAHQVNLMPAESPQDVYSGVARQVEKLRATDAEQGVKIAQVLDGFINRKVVKQTVMTVVYGVTRYGGRLQIQRQLKDIPDFPQDHGWEASGYLVKKVFMSLREIFTLAREIQDWLTESARLISHVGSAVQWVTPLGLPVVQPYHKVKNKLVRNEIQNIILNVSSDTSERPDIIKQKNAFPPNFIHSLDSTHMMLTSLHCQQAGIQYVSVHDCFWTHACTVDTMNRICRQQFVVLHSQPILEDLSKYLLAEYGTLPSELETSPTAVSKHDKLMEVLVDVPSKGDFDLNRVLDSTYFFS
ncbi:PREDICTED: DNA-directed RNA polymerase, mitochondrial-like isoform X1 [Branchiostoma belcheri]|uniref:DNA-directed RNA polymerase n=1 Tax=Branchiostoma belcheri TaxID=7741 RepID=A0A6P4YEN7_BRABE|nr:PREDICTED: DNA-directed RNA polymerase, mitochondrial-like isoform X1 [Branchiostoma belcheri]